MTKKQWIIVGSVVVLLILIIVIVNFVNKKKKPEKIENTNQTKVDVVKEDNEYVVYDKNGREIIKVPENEKYKTRIYELDPNYEEIEHYDEVIGDSTEETLDPSEQDIE